METKLEEIIQSEAKKEQEKVNYKRKRHGKHFLFLLISGVCINLLQTIN